MTDNYGYRYHVQWPSGKLLFKSNDMALVQDMLWEFRQLSAFDAKYDETINWKDFT